ncbi:hypothetical protein SAMN04488515_1071 [Cognatiyoonia koreensis]|uniref:Outer membrane protein beta-barrel domain-containing protein n=1 Tax=Cognatiyoonia koreensis TaxID=364200 RepID=A0A1I0P8H9_9RHOB|nr:hypothetical protein [Cognatiyoonia koreensis]SEW10580.1 hypothetical protein SAMN04488515_1071 [Cognatiyoonia koreensis]
MSKQTFITAAVLAVIGSDAMAQGVTGGSIGVEVTQPTDFDEFVGTNYFGAIEYGINRQFAVSADVSSYRFDSLDQDATSATLHGVYHLSDTASLGGFYGQDKLEDGDSINIFGVEGGTEFMGGQVEGYIGMADNDAETMIFGVDGNYAFSESISFKGGAAFSDSGDEGSASTISIGAEYTITGGPSLYAEVGNVSVDDGGTDESETFVGVGARINFGAARGTTFGQRSIFEALPKF